MFYKYELESPHFVFLIITIYVIYQICEIHETLNFVDFKICKDFKLVFVRNNIVNLQLQLHTYILFIDRTSNDRINKSNKCQSFVSGQDIMLYM